MCILLHFINSLWDYFEKIILYNSDSTAFKNLNWACWNNSYSLPTIFNNWTKKFWRVDQSINPRYKVPSRKHVAEKWLSELYSAPVKERKEGKEGGKELAEWEQNLGPLLFPLYFYTFSYIYIYIYIYISSCNHLYLYEAKYEFILISPILIYCHMNHSCLFPYLSLNPYPNSDKPVSHHLPCIYLIFNFNLHI